MSANRLPVELVRLTDSFQNPFKDGRKSDWMSVAAFHKGEQFVKTVWLYERESLFGTNVFAQKRETLIGKPFRYGDFTMVEYLLDDGTVRKGNELACQFVTDFLSLCVPVKNDPGLRACLRALPGGVHGCSSLTFVEMIDRLICSGKITETDVVESMTWKGEELDRQEWKLLQKIRTAPVEGLPPLMGQGFDDAIAERLGKE